ncbi:MAG: DNA polymerase III subunit gamma/tau, partial [Methylocystis sp.]
SPSAPRRAGATAPQSAPAPSQGPVLRDFPALVALAAEKRDMLLKLQLEQYVRLVRFEPLRLEFELAPGAPPQLPQILTQRLQSWTGERWLVSTVASGGKPTLDEDREARENERRSDIARDPVVAAALACFPGAEIIAVRGKAEEARAPETEIGYTDGAEPDED